MRAAASALAITIAVSPAFAARAEFDAARGQGYKYKSLLGDRKPPLDYRD